MVIVIIVFSFDVSAGPVIMPLIYLMIAQVHSISDLSPIFLMTLVAAMIASMNTVLAVLKASVTTKAQIVAFSTGMLLSGVIQVIWLPYLTNVPMESFTWIVMFATLSPGIALAAAAKNPKYQVAINALNSAIIGGFIFIGVLSGWIGGGSISLTSLATVDV